MISQPPRIGGSLNVGGESFAFEVEAISVSSIEVRFAETGIWSPDSPLECPDLLIQPDGREVRIGPCRLDSGSGGDGRFRRVTPLDGSLDLEQLLVDTMAEKAKSVFMSLPTLLAYKDGIEPDFRKYVSDLVYDLSIYRKLFDDFDRELGSGPERFKDLSLKAVIGTEAGRFYGFLDEKLAELSRLVAGFDKTQHRRHGYFFRRQMWDFIIASDLIARGNIKPRGYSGDSKMMSLIYANGYRGESTFAKLLFKHSADHPASQAVRNRRALVAEGLRDYRRRAEPETKGPIRVLSVASGGATEMWDIIKTPEDCSRLEITLLDQDELALAEARQTAVRIGETLGRELRVGYLNHSVRTMLRDPDLKNELGKYDFIYSMGLFDYLTPRVGRALMSRLCALLKDGGELLAGNFHVSNPSRHYMEYWVDWVLYYRTEEEFRELLNGTPVKEAKVYFEDTRSQMFLRVRK